MGKELQCCRVCLRKSRKSIPLQSLFRLNPPQLSYICIFNVSTRLGADHDDALPQHICANCVNDLVIAFNFLQLAQETDRKLRTHEDLERRETRSSTGKLKVGRKISEQIYTELQDASSADNIENNENNIKVEFIACLRRDPLEETDEEEDQQIANEKISNWRQLEATICNGNNKSANEKDSDDEDDNKPLKELFKKLKEQQFDRKSNENIEDFVLASQVDDDADNDNLSNSANEDMHDFAPSPEAQIFPQGRYKCKQCVNAYFTAVGLKAHNAVHLPKADKIKKSRGQNKKGTKDLSNNNNVEHSKKNVGATMEEIDLEHQSTVQKLRKQKQPKPKKMFPCHVCGKHMISASKLRYHMVMHTGEKDYLCTMCPKAYSTIYALKHHMRTHTGERPYECKFCGDKFTRPTTLKSHMRRHTGERPYGCDICGKRFIQHSSMTTHMKLNHMAKTIPCPHCDKKYARQTDLTTHLLSHTGDKPFSCQLCSSRFIRQANLNKHMNQHHHPTVKTNNVSKKISALNNKTQATRKLAKDLKNALHKDSAHGSAADVQSMPLKAQNNLDQSEMEAAVRTNNIPAAEEAPYLQSTALIPDIFSSNISTGTLNTSNNRDIIGNLDSIKGLQFPHQPQPDNQQQPLFNQTTTTASTTSIDSERLGRAIENINRWSWSANAT